MKSLFSKRVFQLLATTLLLVGGIVSLAQAQYVEGTHYTKLAQPVRVAKPGKIELVEVFQYGCNHCFFFEPLLKNHLSNLPQDVNFVGVHVIWDGATELLARAYYTAQALNAADKVHDAIFSAIHLDRKNLRSEAAIEAIFVAKGVDQAAFKKTFNSFGVNSMVKQAQARVQGYKVTGTPQLVVHGQYVIAATNSISQEQMLEIATFLINKVRQEGGY